jgi:hypothetical protein
MTVDPHTTEPSSADDPRPLPLAPAPLLSACCAPVEQETCCTAEDKEACCVEPGGTSCGCQ